MTEQQRLEGIVLHVTTTKTGNEETHYKISLRIGHFIQGKPFVTSSAIRRAIQKTKLPENRPIGRIEFYADHARKVIVSHEVFPTSLLFGKKKEAFQGIGLSTLVDLAAERLFRNVFPDYFIRSTANPKEERRKQLLKRQREIGKPIPIHEAHARTKEQVVAHFRKNLEAIKKLRSREKRRNRLMASMNRRRPI